MSAKQELLDLYRELDTELDVFQGSCHACGSCCDFSTHENVLYASRLERDLLRQAGRISWASGEEVCPFLSGGQCTARLQRTLGCRTHFCDETAAQAGQEFYEKCRAKIAEISRRHGIPWDYAPVLKKLKEVEK